MSDSPYYAAAPKRGLVGALNPIVQLPRLSSMSREWWMNVLFKPFDASSNSPAWWESMIIFCLNLFASLFHGWVFLAIWGQLGVAVGPATFLQNFVLAITAAGAYAISATWTYDDRLPTFVLWEISFSVAWLRQIGFVTALLFYGASQVGGYVVAGAIVMALGVAPGSQVINVAANSNAYPMVFFGAFVVVYAYVFNHLYRNDNENAKHNHHRKVKSTMLAIFVMTLVCAAFGTPTLTGPQYIASLIVRAGDPGANASVANLVPQAWYICVPMLMVPFTVFLISVILMLLQYAGGQRTSAADVYVAPPESGDAGDVAMNKMQIKQGMSTRLVQRKIQVNL